MFCSFSFYLIFYLLFSFFLSFCLFCLFFLFINLHTCNSIYILTRAQHSQASRKERERSGLVAECLTRDREAAGSSLTGDTALWSLSKTHPSLVLVQPRKTRPCLTERLLMGRKESNQTKKTLDKSV